ncbi:hypothetical protein GCM10010260_29030 [Streptomyces filipinensis]|uniref:Uncharacterized protein n=1 Tax=Streptomyces filipinensis TaxID=66887 RepID=A0A918MAH0_9ACTN|nr:hypothetical protein [Streptomyces filipinensis]GGU92540.1 hypothetical protein GCM10010260_29030 [Streptomyces filipinensis]
MRMTEHTLKRAWQRMAAGSDLLDDAMLPPTGTSPDQCARRAGAHDGLFLVLDEDGTVRGHHGPYREVFATQDLDQVLYFAAEAAVRELAEHIVARSPGRGPATNLVTGQAGMLDEINPAWGDRFRAGGVDGAPPARPCERDPLERLAWIARSWHEQDPYTTLAFFRGEDISAEEIALLHGADPGQTAAGTCLSDLRGMDGDGRDSWELAWQTVCFGQSGDWVFLMYHETPPGTRADSAALARLGVTETVELSACAAKAIYTFDYTRDGRRVDDDWGVLELIWYDRGRAPYYRGGQLDFLNRAVRRAELDHPELTDEFALYFHALETSLGLQLPQRAIEEGSVHAARWARPAQAGNGG